MKITRNVVFDLLPGYFTGDISDDSRALVEAWFAAHADNRQLAAEALAAVDTAGGEVGRQAGNAGDQAERRDFERVRARAALRQATFFWLAGAALAVALGLGVTGGAVGVRNPGLIIGLVFLALAGTSWSVSFRPDAVRWAELFLGWTSSGRE
jgi:anti-sigma factor RsiW